MHYPQAFLDIQLTFAQKMAQLATNFIQAYLLLLVKS